MKNRNNVFELTYIFITTILLFAYPLLVVRTDYYSDLPSYSWYFGSTHQLDFFLQFRSWIIIVIGGISLFLSIHKIIGIVKKKGRLEKHIYIIGIYAFSIVISTILSKHIRVSLIGAMEQYESVFVLLAYLFIMLVNALYLNVFVEYVHGMFFEYALKVLSILMIILGFIQKQEVYLTFYNPDYTSIFLIVLIWGETFVLLKKDTSKKIFELFIIILLTYMEYKTRCVTNIVILVFSFGVFIGWHICKRVNISTKFIGVGLIMTLLSCSTVLFANAFANKPDERYFTSILTGRECVEVATKEGIIKFTDHESDGVALNYHRCTKAMDDNLISGFTIEGPYEEMFFSYSDKEKTYKFITGYKKYLDIQPFDFSLFKNNQYFMGNRGYIWGITFELIKDNLLFGCGPDVFTYVFPHNDYINAYYVGFLYSLITKPHSLYLQILSQTGLVTLIMFIILILFVFINIIKQREITKYQLIPIIIVVSYLLSGFLNDSCVATAPYMWMFIGISLSVTKNNTTKEG